MYPYGSIPLQPSQTQALQHSRPPQPFTTWSAGQNTSAYLPSLKSSNISLPEDGSPQIQTVDSTELGMVNQSAMAAQAFHQVNTQEAGMQADFIQSAAIDSSRWTLHVNARSLTHMPGSWSRKTYDNLEFPNLDPDMPEFDRDFVAHDEDTPIIYLGQYSGLQGDVDIPSSYHLGISRRMSESSFSMSSTVGGGVAEIPSYEDLSSSDVISHTSDCEGWNSLEPAPNLLSPLASPRRPHHELHRSGSRSRASPAPHTSMRSSPYSLDSGRFKRWSTGTYAPTSTPSGSRTITQVQDRFATYGKRLNPHHSMPVYPPSSLGNFPLQTQNVLYSQPHPLQSSNPCIFASQDQPFHLEVPRPLPSQGLFRLLQSNADRHTGCSSHFADLSDPPDLYASLHDEPSNPPESDMNPSDPDLIPHEQDLRFVDDLYTPRWVRGHGNKREGWCGLCKPGRWLVLKNSAFWYDKSFTHGVSAATGAAFHGPQETRRTEGNLDVWEGLCGSCGEWIALVSSKKKGTTWFRHAYKVGSCSPMDYVLQFLY